LHDNNPVHLSFIVLGVHQHHKTWRNRAAAKPKPQNLFHHEVKQEEQQLQDSRSGAADADLKTSPPVNHTDKTNGQNLRGCVKSRCHPFRACILFLNLCLYPKQAKRNPGYNKFKKEYKP
jgi:hypothetical protein